MREIQSVFTHTIEGEVMNEATIRVTLDHVLAGAILALRRKRPERARELYVQSETALKLEGFMWKMRKRTLRGAADYTVWYGPNKELETNFVVWEAKREFKVGEGEPQVLAAMGMSASSFTCCGRSNSTQRSFSCVELNSKNVTAQSMELPRMAKRSTSTSSLTDRRSACSTTRTGHVPYTNWELTSGPLIQSAPNSAITVKLFRS